MVKPLELFYREYGEPDRPAVILLHGLLGSLVNWHSIARVLAESWRVVVPDLRNHGRSPHVDDMGYAVMAADVLQLMDRLGLEQAALVGHSMGGKVAMMLAMKQEQRVTGLVSVDIAPVSYPPRLTPILEALLALPLERISSRTEADVLLAEKLEEKSLRDYLLQNLLREGDSWRWRNNLQVLHHNMDAISSFPRLNPQACYRGPALFVHGAESNYVQPAHHTLIKAHFPRAEIVPVANAGHWLYAERPREFLDTLQPFLNAL